jgi:hypothetical protein
MKYPFIWYVEQFIYLFLIAFFCFGLKEEICSICLYFMDKKMRRKMLKVRERTN